MLLKNDTGLRCNCLRCHWLQRENSVRDVDIAATASTNAYSGFSAMMIFVGMISIRLEPIDSFGHPLLKDILPRELAIRRNMTIKINIIVLSTSDLSLH